MNVPLPASPDLRPASLRLSRISLESLIANPPAGDGTDVEKRLAHLEANHVALIGHISTLHNVLDGFSQTLEDVCAAVARLDVADSAPSSQNGGADDGDDDEGNMGPPTPPAERDGSDDDDDESPPPKPDADSSTSAAPDGEPETPPSPSATSSNSETEELRARVESLERTCEMLLRRSISTATTASATPAPAAKRGTIVDPTPTPSWATSLDRTVIDSPYGTATRALTRARTSGPSRVTIQLDGGAIPKNGGPTALRISIPSSAQLEDPYGPIVPAGFRGGPGRPRRDTNASGFSSATTAFDGRMSQVLFFSNPQAAANLAALASPKQAWVFEQQMLLQGGFFAPPTAAAQHQHGPNEACTGLSRLSEVTDESADRDRDHDDMQLQRRRTLVPFPEGMDSLPSPTPSSSASQIVVHSPTSATSSQLRPHPRPRPVKHEQPHGPSRLSLVMGPGENGGDDVPLARTRPTAVPGAPPSVRSARSVGSDRSVRRVPARGASLASGSKDRESVRKRSSRDTNASSLPRKPLTDAKSPEGDDVSVHDQLVMRGEARRSTDSARSRRIISPVIEMERVDSDAASLKSDPGDDSSKLVPTKRRLRPSTDSGARSPSDERSASPSPSADLLPLTLLNTGPDLLSAISIAADADPSPRSASPTASPDDALSIPLSRGTLPSRPLDSVLRFSMLADGNLVGLLSPPPAKDSFSGPSQAKTPATVSFKSAASAEHAVIDATRSSWFDGLNDDDIDEEHDVRLSHEGLIGWRESGDASFVTTDLTDEDGVEFASGGTLRPSNFSGASRPSAGYPLVTRLPELASPSVPPTPMSPGCHCHAGAPGLFARLFAPSHLNDKSRSGRPTPLALASPDLHTGPGAVPAVSEAEVGRWTSAYHDALYADAVALFETYYGSSDEKYAFVQALLLDALLRILQDDTTLARALSVSSAKYSTVASSTNAALTLGSDGTGGGGAASSVGVGAATASRAGLRRRSAALVHQMKTQGHARTALFCSPAVLSVVLQALVTRYGLMHHLHDEDHGGGDDSIQSLGMSPLETLIHRTYTLAVLVEGSPGLTFLYPASWDPRECEPVMTEPAALVLGGGGSAAASVAGAARVRVIAPGIQRTRGAKGGPPAANPTPAQGGKSILAKARAAVRGGASGSSGAGAADDKLLSPSAIVTLAKAKVVILNNH
ncbi:hypothetical protein H9P43_003606 [Blastocladiella emersonii ATCC 22665]|nr:hypothetical protein H9P43_003606 [Blastocladiella emersonii ATCC 22665]